MKGEVQKSYGNKFSGNSSAQMVKKAVAEKKQHMKEEEAKAKANIEAMKAKGRNRPMLMDGGGGKKTANLA